jgi:hypothetical protein
VRRSQTWKLDSCSMRELWDTMAVTIDPQPIGARAWHDMLPFTFYADYTTAANIIN